MANVFPKVILLVLIATSLSSCRVAYRVLLGVDMTPHWKSESDLGKDFKKRGIPAEQRFVLDTATYFNAVYDETKALVDAHKTDSLPLDSALRKELTQTGKDDLQPTQVRYFDSAGNPIFKLVNCYIRQPIPISWNVGGCFDSFPPKIDYPELNKDNKHLDYFLPHLKTLTGSPVTRSSLPSADWYAVVFWNDFMKRASRKLIRELDDYQQAFPDQKTCFLFVNNHNSTIWSYASGGQKQEILEELNGE